MLIKDNFYSFHMKKALLALVLQVTVFTSEAQTTQGFSFVDKPEEQKTEVRYNGQLLTAYCYTDSIKKPFLWPVNTTDGITVTRGFPLKPVAGERTDHPHHVGLWMNYESVNGLDFWNHSTAIPFARRDHYGTILHQQVTGKSATSDNSAQLSATARWVRPDGKVLLDENTTYTFTVSGNQFFIDRSTTLTAKDLRVDFKDIKDGFFAIRVARELEQPSQQEDTFVDASGNATKVPKVDNTGVTGNYLTSEGVTGDAAWSTRGRWTALNGKKDGKEITIAIFDHPANVGYPAYRHARGYGLFAINPLGQKIFSNGKEELNFAIQPGQSATFRYRMLIASGKHPAAAELNRMADAFAASR